MGFILGYSKYHSTGSSTSRKLHGEGEVRLSHAYLARRTLNNH